MRPLLIYSKFGTLSYNTIPAYEKYINKLLGKKLANIAKSLAVKTLAKRKTLDNQELNTATNLKLIEDIIESNIDKYRLDLPII